MWRQPHLVAISLRQDMQKRPMVSEFWFPLSDLILGIKIISINLFLISGNELLRDCWAWEGKAPVLRILRGQRWSLPVQPEGTKNRLGSNSFLILKILFQNLGFYFCLFIQVLEDFPSVHLPFDWLVQLCPPLKTRAFSISSSPLLHPKKVSLTVKALTFTTPFKRKRSGLCSNWLTRLNPDQSKEPAIIFWNPNVLQNATSPFFLISRVSTFLLKVNLILFFI